MFYIFENMIGKFWNIRVGLELGGMLKLNSDGKIIKFVSIVMMVFIIFVMVVVFIRFLFLFK